MYGPEHMNDAHIGEHKRKQTPVPAQAEANIGEHKRAQSTPMQRQVNTSTNLMNNNSKQTKSQRKCKPTHKPDHNCNKGL